MKTLFTSLLLSLTCLLSISAQSNRTIKITGNSEHNLSPNEIVIQISFQEYFKGGKEETGTKVKIETLETQVLQAVEATGISKEKITTAGVTVVRPYKHGVHKKRRLNKSILVCINNIDEYILLTRELENQELFDQIITTFSIVEMRHTDKEKFVVKSRGEAFANAKDKAKLILSSSGDKLGEVISISEFHSPQRSADNGSFYSIESTPSGGSGFKPIIINYQVEVTFAIE